MFIMRMGASKQPLIQNKNQCGWKLRLFKGKNHKGGWDDGPLGKGLAMHVREPKLDLQNPHKIKLVMCSCKTRAEVETGSCLGLAGHQAWPTW